jgi:hypothetical protein
MARRWVDTRIASVKVLERRCFAAA